MRIIGLMPVRSEDWILGLSVRAALLWMDELIVLNHASADRTAEILAGIQAEAGGRLVILEEPDPVWREMAHRQRLLEEARKRGATHCALVDADEVLTGNLIGTVRGLVEALQPGRYLSLPWLCMWRSPFVYRTDRCMWSQARATTAFRDAPGLSWRTAAGYDHHHREPYGSRQGGAVMRGDGGLMHFQFSDWRRIVAKHALYKMIEVIRWPHRHKPAQIESQYNATLNETGLETTRAPAEWFAPYEHILQHLHVGPEPWQETEVRRLWREHGPGKFKGLNLFGVEKGEPCTTGRSI